MIPLCYIVEFLIVCSALTHTQLAIQTANTPQSELIGTRMPLLLQVCHLFLIFTANLFVGVDGIMLGGTQSSPIMEYDDWYASFEAHEGRGIPMFVRRGPNKV